MWGCSMVYIGKNIANSSKTPSISPQHMRAVRVLC